MNIPVFVLFFSYEKDCLPLGKPARFFHSSDSSSLERTAYTCSWPEGGEKTKYFEVVVKKTLMSKFRSHALKTQELVEAASSGRMLFRALTLSTHCSCSSLGREKGFWGLFIVVKFVFQFSSLCVLCCSILNIFDAFYSFI